jgi:Cellulase (glycosyl hydrolase family 5)
MRVYIGKLILIVCMVTLMVSCRGKAPEPTIQSNLASQESSFDITPTSENNLALPEVPQPTGTAFATISLGQTPTPPSPPLHPMPGIEPNGMDQDSIDLVIQSGAYWVRRNSLMWSAVESTEGQRNWGAVASLEGEIQAASEQGLQVILVVGSTPTWAQMDPGYFCGPILPGKIPAFAQFMYDVVDRYSASPYNVKYWELGNEPDIDPSLVNPDSQYGCWGDKSDIFYGGGYYAEMLKQVYPQIKAANPDAQVLVGGLLMDCDPVNPPEGKDCTPSEFTEGILRSGGGDYFDGISFHAYDYYSGSFTYGNDNWNSSWNINGPVMIAKARYLRSLLASYQRPDKFLINTEAGLICGNSENDPGCQDKEFGLTKAYYVAQVNTSALAEGLRANIWYSLQGWLGTGLLDDQGNPNAAFDAYRFNTTELLGAGFVRTVNEITGVHGYELRRGDKRVMILWSLDGEDHSYRFDRAPDIIYNVFGEEIQMTQDFTITIQPFYLEWGL